MSIYGLLRPDVFLFYTMKKSIFLLSLLSVALTASAAIHMPLIFRNFMVLQQEQKVKFWGTAEPNAKITLDYDGKKNAASTSATSDGKWVIYLNPLKASKKPVQIVISENGKPQKYISDVLVGEVWVTGGQSNMAFGLRGINGSEDVIKRANYPDIRIFWQPATVTSNEPATDVDKASIWRVCSPDMIAPFSAMAVLFAEHIRNNVDVPVGIISTEMSGTPMVSWVSENYARNSDNYKERMEHFDKKCAEYDYDKAIENWEKGRKDHEEAKAKAIAEGKPVPAMHYQYTDLHKPWEKSPDSFRTPSKLFNGKIAPIAGYTARGFLWYQGENDAGGVSMQVFDKMLAGLIECWRKEWGNANMPFIFMQLPSWGEGGSAGWPEVRQKQSKVAKENKNVFMCVAIDTGEEKDIHPKDKLALGTRLGNIALKEVYGKKNLTAYGPTFKDVKFAKAQAKVSFYMDGSKFKKPQEEITGFEILNEDEKWVSAKASITGKSDEITLSADGVKNILGVRYAYKPWAKPLVNLFNEAGLPTAPFTTNLEK